MRNFCPPLLHVAANVLVLSALLIQSNQFVQAEEAGAGKAASVGRLIDSLPDKMYVIGETKPSLKSFQDAEAEIVAKIRDLVKQKEGAESLVAKSEDGMLPLTKAAFFGYSGIVEELLNSAEVKQHINETDKNGYSAWTYSMFSLRQTMSVCNPSIMSDPFRWVPLYVITPYYMESPENPYVRTRKLLEGAGAKQDLDGVKKQWNDLCKRQGPKMAERVTAGADLQAVLHSQSAEALKALLRK